jgi:hypothetical protein
MRCTFCAKRALGNYTLTSYDGTEWKRHVLPVCPRCNGLLDLREGRRYKATGVIWYAGHGVGVFKSAQPRHD